MATKIASAAQIQAVPHQDPKKPRRTPDTIVSPKKNQRSALAASVTSSSSRMRTQVEVTGTREVEGDDLRLARLFASESLVDHDTDRVRRFRCRQVALGTGEHHRGLECRPLVYSDGLDHLLLVERAHRRRHT